MWPFRRKKATQSLRRPTTILERVAALLRANIHGALDAAEDPEKALDLFVRDFTASIDEAEEAVAETIGHLRIMQADLIDSDQEIESWGEKAAAAARRDGERFQLLAKDAILRQIGAEERSSHLRESIARQEGVVEQLKNGLDQMRSRLSEVEVKRAELISRSRVAEAQERVVGAVRAVNGNDPTSQIGALENSVRKREAIAQGRAEIVADSLEAQYDSLEKVSRHDKAERRLAALRTAPARKKVTL